MSGTTVFGSGEEKRVVEKYHNVIFEQGGEVVELLWMRTLGREHISVSAALLIRAFLGDLL
jgi:hypothetical protein